MSILLVPLLPVADDMIDVLAQPISSVFNTTVDVDVPKAGVVETVFDPSRGQFNSTQLIRYLLSQYDLPGIKVLGITSVDLFVPILTYVFGEAQLGGTAGVMSMYRYDETLYGMDPSPVLSFERSLKEAIHELGHTFGLLHCSNYECSMHASTTVDDVDAKGTGLCGDCRKLIGI